MPAPPHPPVGSSSVPAGIPSKEFHHTERRKTEPQQASPLWTFATFATEISYSLFFFKGLFRKFNFVDGTLVYKHYINFMCTTLYFFFCIHYTVFTTKNLHQHTVDPIYPFCPPLHPFPSGTSTLFSVSMCLLLFGLFCSFILVFCFYIPHMSEIIWYLSFFIWLISLSIILSRSNTLLQMARFYIFYG